MATGRDRVLQPAAAVAVTSSNARDPRKCVILVPFLGYIHQECDDGLKELERRGYAVRRVGGYAAIDQARNQMASDALRDGFEETLWIDSDIGFDPDSVERPQVTCTADRPAASIRKRESGPWPVMSCRGRRNWSSAKGAG